MSYYADRACITATFSDKRKREVARILVEDHSGNATVDCVFDDVTVLRSPDDPDLE